jgi:XTP/dITP diphosphohydrolase
MSEQQTRNDIERRTIVLATGNPHKIEEMRAIFAAHGLRVIGLTHVLGGPFEEPRETGTTFEENATIKALSYAEQTGKWCLADDSGLEVDALGGKPGVISSHYSTDGVETGLNREERDRANNERVLRELAGAPLEKRAARFVCVMVLAEGTTSSAVLAISRGTFEGRIGLPPNIPRGANGFGYDPIFLLPAPETRTSAELSPDEKNARSHRAMAAGDMARAIEKLLATEPESDQ